MVKKRVEEAEEEDELNHSTGNMVVWENGDWHEYDYETIEIK